MSETPQPPTAVSRERREQAIQSLVSGFAEDRITLEELERRLDVAHRTADAAELDRLVSDLPAPQPTGAPSPKSVPLPATAPSSEVREQQVVVAVMSGVARKGRWTPARHTNVIAVMGGAEIDLREAVLPPGETEISVFTIWGGVEILVPPGVNLDVTGFAIMGAFEETRDPTPATPGGPTIRVTGFALMAGVEVSARYPGESARDARRRLKEEQRLRRLPSD